MDDSSQQNSLLPKLVLVLLILLVITFFLPDTARSQSRILVAVEPADLDLNPGKTSMVSVRVEGASEFYGIEIRLRYDPKVIQIQDADPNQTGVQVSAGDLFEENQGFLVRNQTDNQQGELVYAFTLLAPAPPMTGSGTLIAFEVVGVADGNSDLELNVILASPDGVALPLEQQSGHITVGAELVEPATRTPTRLPPSATATGEIVRTSTATTPSPTLTASPPDVTATIRTLWLTDNILPTSEPTQPPKASPTPTPTTAPGEPLASPSPGDYEGTAGIDTTSEAKNNTLWITGILFLGIGGIAGGIYLYRRKQKTDS